MRQLKRLTFCLALLAMLITGTVGAYRIIEVPEVGARTITMVMGGVTAASCSSTWQSDTTGTTPTPFNNGTRVYAAQSFTAASATTLYHVTTKLRRFGTCAGCSAVTLALCTNNAVPTPDAPTATCTNADNTIAAADVATGGTEQTFNFSAGYEVSADRYWLRLTATGGDASNYFQHYYNVAGTEVVLHGDATPTWTSQDAEAIGYYILSNCE